MALIGLALLACAPDELFLELVLLWREAEITTPAQPGSPEEVVFVVEEGENAAIVARRLEERGLITDAELFRLLARRDNRGARIQAGEYLLGPGMSPEQILETITEGRIRLVTVTVREGLRAEEVAELLEAQGLAGYEAVMELVQSAGPQYAEIGSPPSLEGYLFPDTYRLPPSYGAPEIVDLMVRTFDQKVTEEMRRGFEEQGLTLRQAVVLASIVERETPVPAERPVVASVFLNRLALGMKLDADPTVQYALGRQEGGAWWKRELLLADLEVESPYNTYRQAGLPPGPIASPGAASLQAVARPAETDYLYFVARGDGTHHFSVTFEEHQRKVNEYRGGS